jgi:hypothetical protein
MLDKITRGNPLLSASLLLLAIFLLILVAMSANQAAFEPDQPPRAMVATVTPLPAPLQTETATATITPTPRPTWTLAPTQTPTQTATPTSTSTITPLPTLPAARPLRFNDLYQLSDWSPERADYLVRLMQSYPNARFRTEQERQTDAYNQAFIYPAFAAREALLRYPEAQEALRWRWEVAYSLSRFNDPSAGEHYAALIVQALNDEQVTVENLPAWFSENEGRMSLTVHAGPAPEGASSSHLLEIKTTGGGTLLWLVKEGSSFRVSVLVSRYNFPAGLELSTVVGDLTGDDTAEAAVFFSPGPGDYVIREPQVFRLTQLPPTELSFAPTPPFDFGSSFENRWLVAREPGGEPVLQFIGETSPACPVRISRTYRWDGERFDISEANYTIQPLQGYLAHCESTITHASLVWEAEVTYRLMKVLLPDWPPAARTNGRPYPADAGEEWRFRTGVFAALAGERLEAIELLQPLERDAQGRWAAAAAAFLSAYQSQEDIYRACLTHEACDPRLALRSVVRLVPLVEYDQIPAYLQRYGIALRSSGLFDFENDGAPERWILVRHRENQKLELWILAASPERIEPLMVEVVDTTNLALRYHEPVEDPPIVQINPGEGFRLMRVANSGMPYIERTAVTVSLTMFTEDTFAEIDYDLFSGVDPAQIVSRLTTLTEASRFNCRQFCDRFYYTLGLAYELSGEGRKAIDQYIDLWWNYSASPYTHMARTKLVTLSRITPGVPTTTPTTPTSPSGPTAYPINTPLPTNTPFPTNTPYP